MLDADKILKLVQDELDDADSVETTAAEALAYFECERPEPMEQENGESEWSDLVSPDVRNAVLATMAEIMPGFTGDMPAMFQPTSAEDEKQADDESRIVTHVIFTKCKGYELLMRAIQDALLFKVGVMQVSWDTRKEVIGDRITGMALEQVQMLGQQGIDIASGEQLPDGSFTIDVKRTIARDEPRIEWVPASELLVNEDHWITDMDEARFVARRRAVSASDLVAAGIDKEQVDKLQDVDGDATQEDKSARMITVCECYMRVDQDEDGIAELRRIITGGGADGDDELLDERPWDVQPFAVGVPYLHPQSWKGISLHDRLKYIQDLNSDLERQILETGWRNLIQRIGAVERLYNHNDLVASRRGGVVRLKDANALVPIPDVQLSPLSLQLLQMSDKMRREAGGGAIDTAPQVQEMGGDTAHGLERMMSAIEQTNAMVAKNLAETLVTSLYVKTHRMLKKHWQGVIQARAGKSWLQQTPQEWQDRADVDVSVGLSVGDRNKQALSLASVIQMQKDAMQNGLGGVLVSEVQLHNAAVDYGRMIGLNAPEQYWIDPQSEEAKQAQQNALQKEQKAQEQAAAAAKAQLDAMLQVEQIRADAKRYDTDLGHVQSVNEDLVKVLELSAKYTAQDVEDFKTFQEAMAAREGRGGPKMGENASEGPETAPGEGY